MEKTYDFSKEMSSLNESILFIMELSDRLLSVIGVIEKHNLQGEIECYESCLSNVIPICGNLREAKDTLYIAEEDLNGMTRVLEDRK